MTIKEMQTVERFKKYGNKASAKFLESIDSEGYDTAFANVVAIKLSGTRGTGDPIVLCKYCGRFSLLNGYKNDPLYRMCASCSEAFCNTCHSIDEDTEFEDVLCRECYSERLLFENHRIRITGDKNEDDEGFSWACIENKTDVDIVLQFPETDDFCDVSFSNESAPEVFIGAKGKKELCAFELGPNWLQAFEQGDFSLWGVSLDALGIAAETIEEKAMLIDRFNGELRSAAWKYGCGSIDVITGADTAYGMYHSPNNSFRVTEEYDIRQLGAEQAELLATQLGLGYGEC